MGSIVLDTSIVLAMFNPGDVLHKTATATVSEYRERGSSFVVPTSVLSEALVLANRRGSDAVDKVESFIDLLSDDMPVIDRVIAREAAVVRAVKNSVKTLDAFVIATGRVVDASVILTGDRKWAGVDRRVEVIC